jgi:hypothetical protein
MTHRARRSAGHDAWLVGLRVERIRAVRTGSGADTGMRCDRLVELVTDYLDGALDGPAIAAFEAHVAGCPGCDAYVDQMRQTARRLGQVSLDGLSDAARDRLLQAFGDLLG